MSRTDERTLVTVGYETKAVCSCGWESLEYKSKMAAERAFREHLAEPCLAADEIDISPSPDPPRTPAPPPQCSCGHCSTGLPSDQMTAPHDCANHPGQEALPTPLMTALERQLTAELEEFRQMARFSQKDEEAMAIIHRAADLLRDDDNLTRAVVEAARAYFVEPDAAADRYQDVIAALDALDAAHAQEEVK